MVKNRLIEFIEKKGLNVSQFEKRVGISNGYVNNIRKSIGDEALNKILAEFPDLNKIWLLHGDEASGTVGAIHHAPQCRLPKRLAPGQDIPFYDIDFAAGDIEFYNGQSTIQAAYTMDIPEFSGCTAFRTYGDSMEKLIRSGDILFGTRVDDWRSHLEYGQIYGIICTDKRRYLKYIRKAKKDDSFFLLKSENEAYDDFLIPKDKIKNIWLIHGWMNKRV